MLRDDGDFAIRDFEHPVKLLISLPQLEFKASRQCKLQFQLCSIIDLNFITSSTTLPSSLRMYSELPGFQRWSLSLRDISVTLSGKPFQRFVTVEACVVHMKCSCERHVTVTQIEPYHTPPPGLFCLIDDLRL